MILIEVLGLIHPKLPKNIKKVYAHNNHGQAEDHRLQIRHLHKPRVLDIFKEEMEDEDYKHYMFKLTKFHSMLLLLTSQQTNDELLCK